MRKHKKKQQGFSPKDMEILLKASREKKSVFFDKKGHPVIKRDEPRYAKKSDTPQVGGETVGVKPGSLLSPIEDIVQMACHLELFAAHCSERLSEIEKRREDCTHQLEPQRDKDGNIIDFLSDDMILAIGKKLQRIGKERRNIKNRFEVIKAVKKAFASHPGEECLAFLEGLLQETAAILTTQQQRTYSPRTNELDDIMEEIIEKCSRTTNRIPGQSELGELESPISALSEEMLMKLLREYEASEPTPRKKVFV